MTVRLKLRPAASGQGGIQAMRTQLSPPRPGRGGLGWSGKKPQPNSMCWRETPQEEHLHRHPGALRPPRTHRLLSGHHLFPSGNPADPRVTISTEPFPANPSPRSRPKGPTLKLQASLPNALLQERSQWGPVLECSHCLAQTPVWMPLQVASPTLTSPIPLSGGYTLSAPSWPLALGPGPG